MSPRQVREGQRADQRFCGKTTTGSGRVMSGGKSRRDGGQDKSEGERQGGGEAGGMMKNVTIYNRKKECIEQRTREKE